MPVPIPTPVVVNTRKGGSGMLGLAKSEPGRLLETIAWCHVGFPAGVMSFRRASFISWPPTTPKVTWSADRPFLLLLWSRRTVEHGLSCGRGLCDVAPCYGARVDLLPPRELPLGLSGFRTNSKHDGCAVMLLYANLVWLRPRFACNVT